MAGGPSFQALTVRSTGRASQIISDLSVCAAYDPKSPPSPIPERASTKALWDTGASKSVISQPLARQLGLKAAGATNVSHAGGSSISPTYLVNFFLPTGVGILGVLATEFPGHINFGAIIGMDVITLGDFSITNVDGRTCMSFRTPSLQIVDYVADHRKAQFAGTPQCAVSVRQRAEIQALSRQIVGAWSRCRGSQSWMRSSPETSFGSRASRRPARERDSRWHSATLRRSGLATRVKRASTSGLGRTIGVAATISGRTAGYAAPSARCASDSMLSGSVAAK
jgi:hypothetical protein